MSTEKCSSSIVNQKCDLNFQKGIDINCLRGLTCRKLNRNHKNPNLMKINLQNGYKGLINSSNVCRIYKEIDPNSLVSSKGFMEFRKRNINKKKEN